MSQFYKRAGLILRDLERKNGSLKSLVFNCPHADLRLKKKLYALLCKTVRYKRHIDDVIKACKLMEKEPKLFSSYHAGLVLVCDVLYGRGVRCGGVLKFSITRHVEDLKQAKERLLASGLAENSQVLRLPRYARINTLKTSVQHVLQVLERGGYVERSFEDLTRCSCFTVADQGEVSMRNCYSQDTTIPGLLVFCHCTPLAESHLYCKSLLILQDKASCLPAFILAPGGESHVIDACAAPGNKTTQLASLMSNTGLIYAFDKDPKRVETLKAMVDRAGARHVRVQLTDFLEVDPSAYSDVGYILVDPSCSGSGMYSRLDYDSKKPVDVQRLRRLASFQRRILNHALSFPTAVRVIYSTCSLHKEENEYVVRNVLLENASEFHLVHILPDWRSRGLPVFTKASCCIRSSTEDKTNGFFVAMFERHQQQDLPPSDSTCC